LLKSAAYSSVAGDCGCRLWVDDWTALSAERSAKSIHHRHRTAVGQHHGHDI